MHLSKSDDRQSHLWRLIQGRLRFYLVSCSWAISNDVSRFEWNRVVSSESWLRRSEFVPVVGLNINSHVNCTVFAGKVTRKHFVLSILYCPCIKFPRYSRKNLGFADSFVSSKLSLSLLCYSIAYTENFCAQLRSPTELSDPFHCRIAVCPWRFDCHNLQSPEIAARGKATRDGRVSRRKQRNRSACLHCYSNGNTAFPSPYRCAVRSARRTSPPFVVRSAFAKTFSRCSSAWVYTRELIKFFEKKCSVLVSTCVKSWSKALWSARGMPIGAGTLCKTGQIERALLAISLAKSKPHLVQCYI